jgi:hypothetical protein
MRLSCEPSGADESPTDPAALLWWGLCIKRPQMCRISAFHVGSFGLFSVLQYSERFWSNVANNWCWGRRRRRRPVSTPLCSLDVLHDDYASHPSAECRIFLLVVTNILFCRIILIFWFRIFFEYLHLLTLAWETHVHVTKKLSYRAEAWNHVAKR